MSEWDFLWGLEGDELMEAMSSGMTDADYAYLENRERKNKCGEWKKLKDLRDKGLISREEFRQRKAEIFNYK